MSLSFAGIETVVRTGSNYEGNLKCGKCGQRFGTAFEGVVNLDSAFCSTPESGVYVIGRYAQQRWKRSSRFGQAPNVRSRRHGGLRWIVEPRDEKASSPELPCRIECFQCKRVNFVPAGITKSTCLGCTLSYKI